MDHLKLLTESLYEYKGRRLILEVIKGKPRNVQQFRNLVKKSIFYVVFIKKYDKIIRKLIGTTNLDFVPLDHWPKIGNKRRYKNMNIVRCFDLNKGAWRSFDIKTLISVKVYYDREIIKTLIANPEIQKLIDKNFEEYKEKNINPQMLQTK